MFEKVLQWCSLRRGLTAVMLRYFNAAGATRQFGEDHAPETHLIPNVLKVALGQKEKVEIFGGDYDTPDGTCVRDYIHIVDLAQAHMLALGFDRTEAFNLGNGDGYSVKEVIAAARAITGHPIPEKVSPRRPGDPDRLVAAATKAKTVLGWKPEYPDLRSIIQSAWDWTRTHPQGYAG